MAIPSALHSGFRKLPKVQFDSSGSAELVLTGCSTAGDGSSTVETPETRAEETPAGTDEAAERKDETVTKAVLSKELAQIPADYFEESESPGTLVELEYDTYESMTYEEQSQVLHKRAIVYLPSGYSEEEKYNVFYLMHGGWSDFFIFAVSGTDDFAYSSFKHQIEAMADVSDGTFRYADNEKDGNLYFLEQEGGTHSGEYAIEYFYNGLCWI